MADTVTAASIAGGALRKVGAFPASKRDPNPHELRVAVDELDKLCSHIGAARQLPWLRRTYRFAIAAGTSTLALWQATQEPVVAGDPPVEIERWDSAHLVDPVTTRRRPVTLWREGEWRERCQENRVGPPEYAWVEHTLEPVLHLYPTPDAGHDGWTLELIGCVEAPNLAEDNGAVEIPMPKSWRLFLETALAVILGKGPIRRLEAADIVQLQADAKTYELALFAGSVPESRRSRVATPHRF